MYQTEEVKLCLPSTECYLVRYILRRTRDGSSRQSPVRSNCHHTGPHSSWLLHRQQN